MILHACTALVDVPTMGYAVIESNVEFEPCSIQLLPVCIYSFIHKVHFVEIFSGDV